MTEWSDTDQLLLNWTREEWALWEQQETGGKPTLSTGGLRKRMHDLLDSMLDEGDAIMRTRAPRKAAAAVVSFPSRGNAE